jgi:hypothetical protein
MAVSAIAGFAAYPTDALAATVPQPIVSPTSGPPGTVITVTSPGCTGFVTAALGDFDVGALVSNSAPGDTTTLVVPAGTPPRSYVVAAGCDVYSVNGLRSVPFTVTPAAVVASPHLTG